MEVKAIPFDNKIKKMSFEDITFNAISLNQITEPYVNDNSKNGSSQRSHWSYNTLGFRDIILKQLSNELGASVVKLLIITPHIKESPYDAFAYLANKNIVAVRLSGNAYFNQWMDIIFKKQYEKVEKYKAEGQFERQPELNQNPQFLLTLGKGQYSIKWVNSGMMVDERPYENTGNYLYKKAPRQYNEVKIAKEKQNYLKKYKDHSGANLNEVEIQNLFNTLISTKNLKANAPTNNEKVYNDFKSLAGYSLPKELKTLLHYHSGIENTGFLTAEEILKEWKNWKSIYDDPNWMLSDLTGNNHPDGRKTIGMYTNPFWVPFFSTAGGNFIAIDYAPGSKGSSGQIIAFGADETKIRFIAEDMKDFLQQWIDGKDVMNNGF
ncbi:SMI1/KNR4 family protein [Maribacter sp. Asnod1-A12]|uniref:SMI1/KNR4 family protein n=1 Tax=Maribacter sp. Asnod1-A12 TaxID=3160576 RepID=UPI00386850CE